MPVYNTIKDALKKGGPGHIFTTKGAGRTYVISKRSKGGTDPKTVVSGKIAKGFTPGSATPSADWKSVKSHAARTKVKHGKATETKLTAKARREKDKPKGKK